MLYPDNQPGSVRVGCAFDDACLNPSVLSNVVRLVIARTKAADVCRLEAVARKPLFIHGSFLSRSRK